MAGTAATLQELEVCILCVCVRVCVCVRASMPCLCMRVSVCFHVCAVCMHICVKISPKHLTLHRIHQLLYHIGASFLSLPQSSSAPSVVSAFLGGPPYDESSG